MIDLHTHSIFSDGELLPSELIRRALIKGYEAIAITDHVDISNIDFVIPRIIKACEELNRYVEIKAIPGVEITHVPLETISDLTKEARNLGAKIVIAHGETIVEPVLPGTNRASIKAGVDILAHPGLISHEDTAMAHERGVYLEITSRAGHCLANGHIVSVAMKLGTGLVINTDAHSPQDLITDEEAERIILASGVTKEWVNTILKNSKIIAGRLPKSPGNQ
jgi:histidinol phosphatase-like PHP family hydrolase